MSGKDDTFFWKQPITLGHEIAGEVAAIGSGTADFHVGDRVVAIITKSHPISFQDLLTSPGIGCDGGFAEFVILSKDEVLHIPESVTFAQAPVASDAITTVCHAIITVGNISAGSEVVVVGLGGLGLSATQILTNRGINIYGIETDTRKYATAAQNGARTCVKSFGGFPGMCFSAFLHFSGTGSTTAAATKAVKARGTVVLVGLGQKLLELDTYDFDLHGVTLKGSTGSSIEEVKECLRMIADGKISPLLEEIAFDKLEEALDRLLDGNVVGCLYADPSRTYI